MRDNRIGSLDSLRGIASLIVVGFHCVTSYVIFLNANFGGFQNSLMEFITYTPLKLLWAGNEAVLVFFVLSGFVLCLPFVRGRKNKYSSYIVKRFFRIYIPYIIVMAVSALLATAFMKYKVDHGLSSIYINRWNHEIDIKAILAYIFMINYDVANVNGVVWSLYHEMRISIIFPLIAFIIVKFNFIKSFIITYGSVFVAWSGLSWLAANEENSKLALIYGDFRLTVYYSIFFIAGALLAKYIDVFNLKDKKWYFKLVLFIIAIILINSKVLYEFGINDMKIQQLVSLIGIIILFIVVLYSSFADRLLNSKILLWLGQVSYSLYLVHIPIIMLCTIFLGQIIGLEMAFVLAFFISIPVAGITYKLVELPAIQVGKKVTDNFKK